MKKLVASTVEVRLDVASATPSPATVEEIMTRSIIALRSTERMRAAAETLLLHGVGGAPVELGGAVLGTVTLMDLNRALLPGSVQRRSLKSRRSRASGTVVDVMDMDVVTAPVGTPIPDAVQLMDRRSLDHILVADGTKTVGIVTATDIARGLALHGHGSGLL